jgi:hypothetical protein
MRLTRNHRTEWPRTAFDGNATAGDDSKVVGPVGMVGTPIRWLPSVAREVPTEGQTY